MYRAGICRRVQRALSAVLADPWSDRPRDYFADDVEPADPARAAFVRAQIAVAWARREAGVRRVAVERAALAASVPGVAHGNEWSGGIAPLCGWRGKGAAPWRFRRGFVEEVRLPAALFLKVAAALYARAPVLDLVLTGVVDVLPALVRSPHLERLRSLDLSGNRLTDADVERLVSARLPRLRWLSLYHNRLTDAGVDRIAAARDHLPHLRFVRLDGNPCGDPNPVVDEEGGRAYGLVRSSVEAELRERHGALPWLGDNPSADPPDPETFD